MKYGKKIDSTLARFIIIAIAAAASIPILFMTLSGSLDDSWKFAIHQARLSGLVFGSDIVFTFGPLGFLTYPIYIDRGLWLAALGYTIFTHLMFWGALYVFLKRSKSGLLSTFYVAAAAVVFIQGVIEAYGRAGESYNYFYLFLMAYAYTQTKDKNIPLLGVISAVSALFCYVKFSLGLAAALMFMTLIVLLALQKRYKEAAMGAVMYAAFKVIAGLVLIGGPMAIAAFFYNSWAIADGYADAMAVDGPQWKLAAAVFAWAVFAVFLMFAIRRKNYGDVSYLALAIGMLFINYKHSAGNGSIFEWDFFVTWGMVFTLYYVKKAQDSTQDRDKEGQGVWIKRAAIAVSLVLCAFAAYEFHLRAAPLKEIVTSRVNQIKITEELLANKTPALPFELNAKRLAAYYTLSPSTLELLRGHTVDIFTVDAGLAFYYGLRWHPRPIFQSYSAYTSYLDSLNQRFLKRPDAPEFLLYAPVEFDQKSAVFFEPATYREMLTGYRAVAKDGEFWVLKKKEAVTDALQQDADAVTAPLGARIPFSIDDRYFVFARVYVKYNIMGRAIRVLYRAPNIYIQFYRGGVPNKRYKFCFNAVNGIYLNPFADNAAPWAANEFAIITPYPAFFDKAISVEFFRILK